MRPYSSALLFAVFAFRGMAQQFGPMENLAPDIPTPQTVVDKMLEAGRVRPGEVVYDLGSGDGRILIAAARRTFARRLASE
jgi:hypothetical protein